MGACGGGFPHLAAGPLLLPQAFAYALADEHVKVVGNAGVLAEFVPGACVEFRYGFRRTVGVLSQGSHDFIDVGLRHDGLHNEQPSH